MNEPSIDPVHLNDLMRREQCLRRAGEQLIEEAEALCDRYLRPAADSESIDDSPHLPPAPVLPATDEPKVK